MSELQVLAAIGIGILAGFINVFAGGGSLLTLPFLIFLGLPANVANGTNRIALLMQNITATSSFKQLKVFRFKEGIYLTLPAIAGAIPGAFIAASINQEFLEKFIGVLLIIMLIFILVKPEKWIKQSESENKKITIPQIITFFFIGLYGGFIQAGIGFFLVASLVLIAGADLIKANALKIFIVLIYNSFALAVFFFKGQVNIEFGLIVGIGNMLGAFIATRVAVRYGAKLARIILMIGLVFSALKLLEVFTPFQF
ncbi:MAG: sulfite exporter TauE/SafE family protein [Bacteroidales bacterium]